MQKKYNRRIEQNSYNEPFFFFIKIKLFTDLSTLTLEGLISQVHIQEV